MRGYEITSLSAKTQELIQKEGLDTNKDGLINRDNGELANLLSRTGKNDINELTYDSWFDAKKGDFLAGGFATAVAARGFYTAFAGFSPTVTKKSITSIAEGLFVEHNRAPVNMFKGEPKVSIKQCVQEALTRAKKEAIMHRPIFAALCAAGLGVLGIAAYLFTCKPRDGIAKWTGSNDYQPVERQRSETEDQFRKLYGEDVELNEYTPQKGEYWISILKARYGVDDQTAERMAHRIKDVVYEDSLAAKQTPVMYFPDSWTFEGKTYQYNKDAKAEKTDSYSDDVKTEMGKMSKDLKYE